MIIRLPQSSDFEVVKALLADAGLPTEDFVAEHLVLVADQGGSAVGAIGLEHFGEIGLLRSLVVSEAARLGGTGRRLVAALEEHARSLGESELWLLTIDAAGYFENRGFARRERVDAPEKIRSTREFSGLCPGDAALMSKRL